MENNKPFIIGITGAFGSGKSTAAVFFESEGFKKVILSSFLEEEAKKRDFQVITREILQDIGNEWRKKYGSNILAKKALDFIKKERIKLVVIDGIRNVGEIDELRKYHRFILLAIIADRKVRFDRLVKLKRREILTWELFTKLDRRDLGLGQKSTGLQVAACQALADVFIENNPGIEEFKNKLEKFLKNEKKHDYSH
ncbi:MAG: AAA family ATPase [bacterium]|nr:AAA family ATPase [bacterium]